WARRCPSCCGVSTAAPAPTSTPSSSPSGPRNTSRTTSSSPPRACARPSRSTARSARSAASAWGLPPTTPSSRSRRPGTSSTASRSTTRRAPRSVTRIRRGSSSCRRDDRGLAPKPRREREDEMDPVGTRSPVDDIVARLERLPTSWWQVKARIIVGVATFFDAFDALAIASVLPVIVPLWKLTPPQIGLMISAGFLGQLLGALLFGWIAERYGRMTAMIWSIALFAVMSLACALAWDYNSLLVLRTVQGIGLGGEVPVAAVFISELAKAQGRGRFVLLYELVFPIGLVAAS